MARAALKRDDPERALLFLERSRAAFAGFIGVADFGPRVRKALKTADDVRAAMRRIRQVIGTP